MVVSIMQIGCNIGGLCRGNQHLATMRSIDSEVIGTVKDNCHHYDQHYNESSVKLYFTSIRRVSVHL
jgi:hypothetical protein